MADDITLSSADHHTLSKAWQEMIRAGVKHRKEFREAYDISKKFTYGDHEFMYEETMPDAAFKATVPKLWEMVNIFGPMLAFRNPHRNVRVRFGRPQDDRGPLAFVMKQLLNYAANELDLRGQARQCVDDSLVGLGVAWLERDERSGLFGHFHDSPLNCVVDPDAESLDDAWWIARRHSMPRWEFAGLAGVDLDHEDLPSAARPSIMDSSGYEPRRDGDEQEGVKSKAGRTNELLSVYEVWSRMGVGWRARSIPRDMFEKAKSDDREYVHFYVLMNSRRIWMPGDWPVPLWMDNAWPCEWLYYRKKSDYVWPTPMLKPSLGLQKAINWVMMFMWTHLKTSSRDFIAGSNELDETVRERILSGSDLEWIPLNTAELGEKKWQDLIGFLQHPPMNADLWRYMDLAVRMFEDSTGLVPALYAQSGQAEPRSAEASRNRETRADLRPDDMREVVEAWHTKLARKEAIAARLEYDADLVAEILGPESGQAWGEYRDGAVDRIMREYDYTIEAGSAAKPNLQAERDQSLEVFDRLTQVAMQLGDFTAVNQLAYNLQRSLNVLEEDIVVFQPPPPPEEEQDPTQEAKVREAETKADIADVKLEEEKIKLQTEALKSGAEVAKGMPQGEPEEGEPVAIEGGKLIRS